MTDRFSLMRSLEDLLKTSRRYVEEGLLPDAQSVVDYMTGYVESTREVFDYDTQKQSTEKEEL